MSGPRAAPSLVRILAGRWKGRSLDVPPGARPTSGRARKALFDLLGPDRVGGARVLDLFAGSGAVGLEAVSRGAARAVLVEPDAAAISRTLERFAATPEEARVLAGTAAAAIASLERAGEQFEIVFADPPYGGPAPDLALAGVARLLAPGGVLVMQSDTGRAPATPAGLKVLQEREYGRNVFRFFGIL